VHAKQTEESVFIFGINSDTLFQELAEVGVPSLVCVRVALGFVVDHLDDTSGQNVP
jgi:hypothetical protein